MENLFLIDPIDIRFTHSRIRPYFSGCGVKLEDTIKEILTNKMDIEQLPLITVLKCNDVMFSLNNRRLYVLKHLRNVGYLESRGNMVKVRIKSPLPREIAKYNIDSFSLNAKIMREHEDSNKGIESDSIDYICDQITVIKNDDVVSNDKTSDQNVTFSTLPDEVKKQFKNFIALQKKGKIKEIKSKIDQLATSYSLSQSQIDFIIDQFE
jgi:hypothetical protein